MKSILFLCLIFYAAVPVLGLGLYEIVCNEAKLVTDDCLDALRNNSTITSATNYRDLSKYILEKGLKRATSVHNYLIKVAKQYPNDPAIKQCSTDLYDSTVGAFINALSELDNDPDSAINFARAAGDGPAACEKAIEDEKANSLAIKILNNEISVLSIVAFIAIEHLTHSGGL